MADLEEYYTLPFIVYGKIIEDSKGIFVCQCLEKEYAIEIAKILNNLTN